VGLRAELKRACLPAKSKSRGFTLVELLITVAIILTLAAIAIPNMMAALDYAREAQAI
jgi:prepilin-type N-terminal cleavage/methylation domain-containing protein